MKAFRAYFNLDAAGAEYAEESRFKLVIGGEQTGIANAENRIADNETVYNLQGLQVEKPAKGIYVKGGKKVFVK